MTPTDPPASVRVRRTVAASPEQAYRAWLVPEVMLRWFAPQEYQVARAEVDERVGGRIGVWHVDRNGHDVGGHESVIVELVPGRRIVLDFCFVGPDRAIAASPQTRLTVTFTPTTDGSTDVELIHERLDDLRVQRPDIADAVEAGWTSALDHLAASFTTGEDTTP